MFGFKNNSLLPTKINTIIKLRFSKLSENKSHIKITPEQIRAEIRLMRINNFTIRFNQYSKYQKWENKSDAIRIFKEYLKISSEQYKVDYYEQPNIFDELKILLKQTESEKNEKREDEDNVKQTNIKQKQSEFSTSLDPSDISPIDSNESNFYNEFLQILHKLYVENFAKTEFIDKNIQYVLRSIVFIKIVCENEYLIKNTKFLNEFFLILEKSTNIFIKDLYLINQQVFMNNLNMIEEFFLKIVNIADSNKHMMAYNPTFFYLNFESHLQKIISNFECLILHYCLNYHPNVIKDKINLLTHVVSKYKLNCPKVIDYVNIFLLRNRNNLNVFDLIEILWNLSHFREAVNWENLNYFYELLMNEMGERQHSNDIQGNESSKNNLINYPNNYLIKCIVILAQTRLIGNFVLIERIVKIMTTKETADLKLKDFISIIVSCLKAGYNERSIIEHFLNLIVKNKMLDHLDFVKVRHVKILMDRFVNEEIHDSYLNFFQYVLKSIEEKLNELKCLEIKNESEIPGNKFDLDSFREIIKSELIISKEKMSVEILTFEDYLKYYESCKLIALNCLFKIYKSYEFISQSEIYFSSEDETKKKIFKF